MECNTNGTVYILVDDDDETKEILSVTPAGLVTQVYNFFDRGSGTAAEAGIQRDLAIRPANTFPILYTIDTLNDMLLVYYTDLGELFELFPDTLSGNDPESISKKGVFGERVGLVLLP